MEKLTPFIMEDGPYINYKGEDLLFINPQVGIDRYNADDLKIIWQYDHPVFWAIDADEADYKKYNTIEEYERAIGCDTRKVIKYQPKKQTAEEAAEIFASSDDWSADMNIYGALKNGFLAGVKWKQKNWI